MLENVTKKMENRRKNTDIEEKSELSNTHGRLSRSDAGNYGKYEIRMICDGVVRIIKDRHNK